MKAWLVRIAALLIFAVSFLLPAVRPPASGSAVQPIPGWTCALVASITGPKALLQSLGQHIPADDVEIVLGGFVNYLFVAILILSLWHRLARTRLVLFALMIPCFIATWMFFASQKIAPLIGHYLWIAAAILVVVPDIAKGFSKAQIPATAPANRMEASR